MIIDYVINQLKMYWRKPLWCLVNVLLALPITMLFQLKALQTELESASFISNLKSKSAQTILLTDNNEVQALPRFLSDEVSQALNLTLTYERSFSTFVRLPDKVLSVQASAFSGGFSAFGIKPMLGHLANFQTTLLQNTQVAVLSAQGWQKLFNRNPSAIGHWISLNNQQYQIVAVLDESFVGFRQHITTDIIIPFSDRHLGDGDVLPDTISYALQPEIHLSDIAKVVQQLRNDFLLTQSQDIVTSRAIGMPTAQYNALTQRIHLLQWLILLQLAFCVMAYCGMMLCEQQQRHNEFQLRLMLGATPGDLRLQRWVELTMSAGLLLLLCRLVLPLQHYMLALLFPDIRIGTLTIGFHAYIFSIAAVAIIILISMLVYAIQDKAMSVSLGRGQTQSFWQKCVSMALVSVQLSLAVFSSFITLTLMLQQLNMFNTDLGFKPDDLYILTFDPLVANSTETYDVSLAALFLQFQRTAPKHEVAAATVTPLSSTYMFGRWTTNHGIDIGNVNGGGTYANRVSENFFQVMQSPLLFGRLFSPNAEHEIIVNNALWQRYFKNSSLANATLKHHNESYRIVGVVDDIRYQGPDQPADPIIYQPLANLFEFTQLIIRSEQKPTYWLESLLNAIQQQHPFLSAEPLHPMTDRVQKEHAQRLSLLVLMLILSAGSIASAALFSYASIRQLLATTSTELALRFSMGARLIQLIKSPFLLIVVIKAILLSCLHLMITPKLALGTEPAWHLLLIVSMISILLISLLLLQMFRQTVQKSWQYLAK